MFKKILIANRGEIAVRIIRACREMQIVPVSVFSDADRTALHVRMSDEAYEIGPAPAAESYLKIPAIINAAKLCGADAIHPGYGFLSENAAFAEACVTAGIKFIGPSPRAIRIMGSKTRARAEMEKNGVPCVPGTSDPLKSLNEAIQIAHSIGYPVMLKAAAGGGGKGMRLVRSSEELRSAMESAQSEAQRAFGDDEVYLEKAIENPRHIEIQVLADEHANTIHLGERECSIQRRHQKVLEESPSSFVDGNLRKRMGEAAVQAATAVGYTNAGTVEFLVDAEKNFYFLEMNTRLQVEHPVTEMVTGLDLVQFQINIAAGKDLPFRQEDVLLRGHAIECRIYAEDPDNHYFPSPGKITSLHEPSGPGVRLDCGIYENWTVPPEYDPLLAKLTAHAQTRGQAIARSLRAINEMFVGGIQTNLPLFRQILNDPDFRAGRVDTGYLDRLAVSGRIESEETDAEIAAIAGVIFSSLREPSAASTTVHSARTSRWKHSSRYE